MTPEERAKSESFHASVKYAPEYLKRNVLLEAAEYRPLTDREQKILDEVTEKLNKFEASQRD
jgi:hypothetical protein